MGSPQAAPNKRREQSGQAAHSANASFTRRSLHSIELRMGSACYLLVLLAGLASAHEYFPEKCPAFTPMQGFDWDQFADGVWYVTQKFATRSTCLTYEFTTDELGFKEITQLRQLPYSEKIGLDHEYKYTGKLYAANEALPTKMNVRFPLSEIIIIHLLVTIISIVIMIINMIVRFPLRQILFIVHFYPEPNHHPPPLLDQQRHHHDHHDHCLDPIGAASFVVLYTDYTSYGLICTCQEIDLFITTGHRRSCSMLQRAVEEDEAIRDNLHFSGNIRDFYLIFLSALLFKHTHTMLILNEES